MQNCANCISTDKTLNYYWDIADYMKNQTPRLNAKTVNGNLQEITSFSRSRYEIQGRRQPASSGGTNGHNLEWGNRRNEARRADRRGSWRGGSQFPFHQLWGLGSAVSSPAGSGEEPRPLKVFLAFCATRLPLPYLSILLSCVLSCLVIM